MKNSKFVLQTLLSIAVTSLFCINITLAQMPDIAKEFDLQEAEVSDSSTDKQENMESKEEWIDLDKTPELEESEEEESQENPTDSTEINEASVEDLKQQMLELNRDLLILEEELLFPSSTQVSVFLSMDVGTFFQLDSVRLEIDGKQVATHLYTDRQLDALHRGGVQRLHMGNIKSGAHEIAAFFIGEGTGERQYKREYKRAAVMDIEKSQDPLMLELVVRDSTQKLQPEFEFQTWTL